MALSLLAENWRSPTRPLASLSRLLEVGPEAPAIVAAAASILPGPNKREAALGKTLPRTKSYNTMR